ncbi:MAG: ABC transporter permease, partial [Acetobacterales bacterium]
HLALPVVALAYANFAFLSKLMRSAMLENLSADFVRTARAKGVDENTVLWRHVFRNSLLPLITVAATLLPAMLAGSVIVETIFSVPGMGKLTFDAVMGNDYNLAVTALMLATLLTLLGNLLADLCYAALDPRISLG